MIEDTKVVTGSPAHIEKEVEKYMTEYPDGSVLSSALAIEKKDKGAPATKCMVVLGRKL